jgi:hypothetical protein
MLMHYFSRSKVRLSLGLGDSDSIVGGEGCGDDGGAAAVRGAREPCGRCEAPSLAGRRFTTGDDNSGGVRVCGCRWGLTAAGHRGGWGR